ncbi:T9SS type A sorting domain-containing protein [Carboxylicivirga sp. A043]|uniref:T9SS type A sorting domain-containing protein n=1 Tax=Carboxylicivirga litoralis TaxID=2816963 RepID=UPI0021CB5A65|nr:T9SS type A sorting domain-containing protein [Carboxylicivirga sp. A043]MCU4156227.1 T9SS type A sorting domain-containing protein [Carboxylicivirga sp. A043]
MRYYYIVVLLLLLGAGVKGQNPYADGTVIPGGTSINARWSIAAGTSVSTNGHFTSSADGTVSGDFTVNGNYTHTGWTRDRFLSGSVVEIFGNLYANQELRVANGATLIVHGDFYNYGGGSTRLAGNIVVTGDVYLNNTSIRNTGNIVVGGNLTMSGGSSSSGDIYVLDPSATVNVPGWMGVNTGDEEDFINDESDNTALNDALVKAGLATSVDEPTNFTYTNLTDVTVDLSWTANADGDDVLITVATSDLTINPVDATIYSNGDNIDGATVIYTGSVSPQLGVTITADVDNYFAIWSVNSTGEYSRAVKLTVDMLSSSTPFYEDFENGNANSWSIGSSRGNTWAIGGDEAYMGGNAAYVSEDGATAGYDANTGSTGWVSMEKTIDLSSTDYSSFKSLELSFYWKGISEPGYDGGIVYENRTNTSLTSDLELAGQEAWKEKVIDITDYLNTSFELGFWFYFDWSVGENPALCIDEVRITGSEVARPQSFSGAATSTSQVDLNWVKSVDNDDVIIAYSTFGSIGRPESGQAYTAGDYLSGGGQVIYVGSASSFAHTGNFSDEISYSIWSVNNDIYSSTLSTTVKIPVALPFSEGFESDISVWEFNGGTDNEWVRGKAEASTGTQSAYISNDLGISAGYDNGVYSDTYLELEADLRNFETITLSFEWKANGNYNQSGRVYIDGVQLNGSTDTYNTRRYYDQTSWQSESITLDGTNANYNGIKTIRFRWYNNTGGSSQNPGFCVDNFKITGTIADPTSFSATNPNDLFNTLSWGKNAYDDEVLVIWSSDGVFGTPEEGVIYDEGDVLPGGGTVLFIGDLLSYEHSPLNYGSVYYYKAFSSRNGIYSTGIEASANTPAKVSVLFEDWEDNSDAYPEWSSSYSNIASASWLLGGTNLVSGGSRSAYITADGSTAGYVESGGTYWATLSITVDLTDLHTANLTFDWLSLGNPTYDYGSVFIGSTQIGQEYSGEGTNWSKESINLDAFVGSVQTLEFRWNSTGSAYYPPAFCIDNIEVGGIYEPTSTITNGQKLATSVSSIANTLADAIEVFSFDLTDKSSQYFDITRLQQLRISKGATNTIGDWSDALAGARLFGPDIPAEGMDGVITSSGITFTASDMILLETQDAPETYSIKLWLNADLNSNGINDGDSFDLALEGSNMVTGLGDDFIKIDMVESGAIPVSVIATELRFTQQPSANATINSILGQVPEVAATDANGNIDLNYSTNVVMTNDDGASGSIGMSNVTVSPVNGVASFANLTFTETGVVTLSATSGSWTSDVSNQVTVGNYCQPVNNSSDRYITNVIIESINNTTGDDGGYAEFLDQVTSFAKGETYNISIGVRNNTGTGYAIVWVDWDGDENFDSSESFAIGSTSNTGSRVLIGQIIVPPGALSGTTRMRVRFTQSNNTSTPCNALNGETEDYSIVVASDGWLGQNTNWNVSSNWSTGSVPDGATDIYIPEHPYYNDAFPIIDGTASMNDLDISTNASLTIMKGSLVTINGDVNVQGDFIIENTNTQPTSIITNTAASITGDVTVRWTYDELHWWFTGHSISNPTIATYQGILADLSNTGNKYVLYDYTDAGSLVNLGSTGTEFNQGVTSGERIRGYQLKVLNPSTVVEHVGALNNQASYSKEVQNGWQIIANPYPAYYQLPKVADDSGDFAATEGTVYVSDSDSNDDKQFLTYSVFTTIAVPETFDGVIAPNQAFYIKTKDSEYDSGKLITMDAANRTNASSTPTLKSVSTTPQNLLRFYLSNEHGLTDEAVIALFPEGDVALTDMDSKQRMYSGTNYSYIYSIVDDTKTVINVLPDELKDYQQILGVQTKKGEQQLRISGIDALSVDYNIVLEDKKGVSTTLTNDFVYNFTAEEGVDHERFVLHFKTSKTEVPTDIDDIYSEDGAEVKVYVQNGSFLKVSCGWDIQEKTVAVYTVSGSLVMNDEFSGEVYEAELNVQPGIYIVKVSGSNHQFQEKVLIK